MSSSQRRTRWAATVAALALGTTPLMFAGGAGAAIPTTGPDKADTAAVKAKPKKHKNQKHVKLRLLAINDFHGQLEQVPSTSSSGRVNDIPAGGVAYLAAHLERLREDARKKNQKTFTVAAGDLIGATPLLSAAFHDEPTIEAMNLLGLDIASVGNHEFDEGYEELLRMQRGGCLDDGAGADNQNSCPGEGPYDEGSFDGADFRYLSANVKYADSGETVFPGYVVRKVRGVKVGFVGMTLEDTPNIVTQAGVQGLRFIDEVRAVRQVMPELRKKGVKSIVVLLHEGGVPTDREAYNGCVGVSGPGVEIAERLPRAVDVVVTGHTHQAYNCTVEDPAGNPRLLTSAGSAGRLVTDIRLKIDRRTKDIIRPKAIATNRIVTNSDGTEPASALLALIDRYKILVDPIAQRVLGQLEGTDQLVRDADPDGGDSELGNLIADSQLADPSTVTDGQVPQIAFMNPGGIRSDLTEDENGNVTYGTAFAVQPFNNYVVSMTLTGDQVLSVLNEQWNGGNEESNKILQVAGISYTWDRSDALLPETDALVGDVMVDSDGDGTPDTPLDPNGSYRVVVNSFLADGGDAFGTLAEGTDRYFGGLDIDALAAYLDANTPYTPEPTDRISAVD